MTHIIIIREYRQSDENAVREIVKQSLVSLVTDTFISTLMKEITFQMIVVTAAIMFIFIGVPMLYCLAAIPIVLAGIYFCIYTGHLMKSMELFQERPYQCWVAEACEPFYFTQPPDKVSYVIRTEQEIMDQSIDVGSLHRKVVGTLAVKTHKIDASSIWLYRLAVDNRYRRKYIAKSLLHSTIRWAKFRGYDTIELTVTENQDAARLLFTENEFFLRQMYHKQLIGTALTLLKYQLQVDLNTVKLAANS